MDILLNLPEAVGIDEKEWRFTLGQLVHQSDMLAPAESTAWYQTPEYAVVLEEEMVPYIRNKLDTDGLGEQLIERSRHNGQFWDPDYQTILLGAIMMRAGANIKPEHLLYLRRAARRIGIESVQAQFLAALDHYQPGVPRSFQDDWSVDSSKHSAWLTADYEYIAVFPVVRMRVTLDIHSRNVKHARCSTAIG